MPFGFDDAAAIMTVLSSIGSLFGEDDKASKQQRKVYDLLMERTKGIDPELLQMLRARMRSGIGNEFAGLSASTTSRLRRQNAPMAIQRQIMDKLQTRRLGATTSGMLDIDEMNERVKSSAFSNLASLSQAFPMERGFGSGFSQLFGAGLQHLLSDNYGSNMQFNTFLDTAKKRGEELAKFEWPSAPKPKLR